MLAAIKEKIFIDFVGDTNRSCRRARSAIPSNSCRLQTLPEGLPGVLRRGFGSVRDGLFDIIEPERPVRRVRRERRVDGFHRDQRVDMVPIVRLEQDHLVARIQQRQTGAMKRAGGARAYGDLRLRVGRDAL